MDITDRLRRWTHAADAMPASELMDEAADEIDQLRLAIRKLAEQDATLSVVGGNVIVEMDATPVVRLPPLDPNNATGWNAAIGAVREALADAGVDWDTE